MKISLSTRVTLSLSVLLLIMSLLAIYTAMIFYNASRSVNEVAWQEIPSLTTIFSLILESERMTSVAPDVIAAQNSFIREALTLDFIEKKLSWEKQVASMLERYPQLSQLQRLAELSRDLHSNIENISTVIDERMVVEEKLAQIVRRIQRLGEKINTPIYNERGSIVMSEQYQEALKNVNTTIVLLLASASIQGKTAKLDELERRYLENIFYTEEALARMGKSGNTQLQKVHQELVRYGVGENDLFLLVRKQGRRTKNIEDLLVANTFVSAQINSTTNTTLDSITTHIHELTDNVTGQLKFANKISIVLPIVGIICSIFIFLHLRRSVVGRLLGLQQAIRNHIHGSEVTIPVTGNDEITAMARAIIFFISEINRREQILRESHGKLEQRVAERTMEIDRQNSQLRIEIAERSVVESALRESEVRFRLLAENLKEALCLVEMATGKISFKNRAFKEILEIGDEDFPSNPKEFLVYIHPDDRTRVENNLQRKWGMNNLEDEIFEFRLFFAGGRVKWIFSRLVYIRDNSGKKIHATIMAEDITRRTLTAKKVKDSETRLKYLSTKLIESQEEERRRLAAELHDNIGPSLGAIKFGVENAIDQYKNTAQQRETLYTIISMVKNVVQTIGRIQMELRPSIIDDLGVIDAIDWYCAEYVKIYRHITIRKNIHTDKDFIPSVLNIVIYRVIQEAFNNIAKHSGATTIHLLLESEGPIFRLTIRDDGCGILQSVLSGLETPSDKLKKHKIGSGLGLLSMRERVELTTGHFSIGNTDEGTLIICYWDCSIVEKLGGRK